MTEKTLEAEGPGLVAAALLDRGYAVISLDGRKVKDKEGFLEEFAGKMMIPRYFGKNWDALEECLRDLSWFNAPGFLVILHDMTAFREAQPDEWAMACGILMESVAFWRDRPTPLLLLYA